MKQLPKTHELAVALRNPQWQIIEDHFSCIVPEFLKTFYDTSPRLLITDYAIRLKNYDEDEVYLEIGCFETINENCLSFFEGFEDIFCFAHDGYGENYCIEFESDDPKILIHDYVNGILKETNIPLSRFLNAKAIEQEIEY